MAAPLEMTTEARPEAILEAVGGAAIKGRSLGQIAWMRLRRDRVAMASGYYAIDPMFMVIPGLAIFLTVMAFNLFGDGLRDALDPRSTR